MSEETFKHKLYVIIFGTHTPAGRRFDILLIVAILSSLAVLILDSVPILAAEWQQEFDILEYFLLAYLPLSIYYVYIVHQSPKLMLRAFMAS